MFAERYLNALSTSNLQDDDQHHQTEPLVAAALVKLHGFAGCIHQIFHKWGSCGHQFVLGSGKFWARTPAAVSPARQNLVHLQRAGQAVCSGAGNTGVGAQLGEVHWGIRGGFHDRDRAIEHFDSRDFAIASHTMILSS